MARESIDHLIAGKAQPRISGVGLRPGLSANHVSTLEELTDSMLSADQALVF